MFAKLKAAYLKLVAELRAFAAALRRHREELEAEELPPVEANGRAAVGASRRRERAER